MNIITPESIDLKSIKKRTPEDIKKMCDALKYSVDNDFCQKYGNCLADCYNDQENCKKCESLQNCANTFPGYYSIFLENCFTLKKCIKKMAKEQTESNEKLLSSCHVPEKLIEKSIKAFSVNQLNKNAFDAACNIIQGKSKKGLILYGPTGTGKTHLLAAILNNIILKGGSGLYCVLPELMDNIRSSLKINAEDVRKAIYGCNILLLDDIGTESATDFVTEELYKIVNSRYLYNKMIIGTTNLNESELINHYSGITGKRIFSRLKEMCDFIEVNGLDHRI
ncbi:MAG TPA: hypothetical protein DCO75_02160 [Fibrobacteres bacterium]|jgi:DNA replication protein DnaC|nr:hypothetical protein [Fibrobacterota bacterium]